MIDKIIGLFTKNQKLRFSDIEKLIGIRSNKLDYHLKKLVEKKVIVKTGKYYSLSEDSEPLIPYISDEKSPLPVVLIHIGNEKKAFLIRRKKRPYQNFLSLPGGRIRVGENIGDAVGRIMKDKYGINAKLKKVYSVSMEHIRKNGKVLHSFILFFVSANGRAEETEIDKNRLKIIESDFKLLKNDLGKEIKLNSINSRIKS